MMHEIAHYNWAGLAFVFLVFPAAGLMTVWLRKWSERVDGGADRGKIRGGVHVQILPDRRAYDRLATDGDTGGATVAQPANAIDSSNYRAPEHAHVYDLARSRVVLCEDGSAMVECAMQGCGETRTHPAGALVPIRSW